MDRVIRYLFESPKIILNKTSDSRFRMMGTIDANGYYCDQRLVLLCRYSFLHESTLRLTFPGYPIAESSGHDRFYLGLLNSALINFFFMNFVATRNLQGSYSDVLPKMMRSMPLYDLDLQDSRQSRLHDTISDCAGHLLQLHIDLASATSEGEKTSISRQINSFETQLDDAVFDLYDLSAPERAQVRKAFE